MKNQRIYLIIFMLVAFDLPLMVQETCANAIDPKADGNNEIYEKLNITNVNMTSSSVRNSEANKNLKMVFIEGPISFNEIQEVTSSGYHAGIILEVQNATNISYSYNLSLPGGLNASADEWVDIEHADYINVTAVSDVNLSIENSSNLSNYVMTVITNGSLRNCYSEAIAGIGEEDTNVLQRAQRTSGDNVYVETYAQNNESQHKKWFNESVADYNITASACAECTHSCVICSGLGAVEGG